MVVLNCLHKLYTHNILCENTLLLKAISKKEQFLSFILLQPGVG